MAKVQKSKGQRIQANTPLDILFLTHVEKGDITERITMVFAGSTDGRMEVTLTEEEARFLRAKLDNLLGR